MDKSLAKENYPADSYNTWQKFYRLNNYYHANLHQLVKHLVPSDVSVIEFGCRSGELLSSLPNKKKVGVDYDGSLIAKAKQTHSNIEFLNGHDFPQNLKNYKFDYIILSDVLFSLDDVQNFVKCLKNISHQDTRIIVFYFNFFWKPFMDLAEKVSLKYPKTKEPNWLSAEDIDNFFALESFDKIKAGKRFLATHSIPYLSNILNKYVSLLPIINDFSLTNYSIYRPIPQKKEYSVSIVIPARNEEGNIKGLLNKIPKIGKKIEVIFVEGHSKDNTYQSIKDEIQRYKGPIKAFVYKQRGVGKGDAVRLGFEKATNELLMILDADLTVDPSELTKFYNACSSGLGDLIMGSRLVYPMEKQAMRNLNYIGNKFFSLMFTFLLGQRIKDTLCGTKVMLKKNYEKIKINRKIFGDFDPFGDYDLIFGAAKLNFKIVEIPIRYKERVYGTTNIHRFRHGLLLLKMVGFAAKHLKFT